jgi:hypothetical protein
VPVFAVCRLIAEGGEDTDRSVEDSAEPGGGADPDGRSGSLSPVFNRMSLHQGVKFAPRDKLGSKG